jgi:hypothetical protein
MSRPDEIEQLGEADFLGCRNFGSHETNVTGRAQ